MNRHRLLSLLIQACRVLSPEKVPPQCLQTSPYLERGQWERTYDRYSIQARAHRTKIHIWNDPDPLISKRELAPIQMSRVTHQNSMSALYIVTVRFKFKPVQRAIVLQLNSNRTDLEPNQRFSSSSEPVCRGSEPNHGNTC